MKNNVFALVTQDNARYFGHKCASSRLRPLAASIAEEALRTVNPDTVSSMKSKIMKEIATTKRGLSANLQQRISIEQTIQALEQLCPVAEPARDPRMAGRWVVQYTTAPPPSNGQLGPFVGVAKQEIDLKNGTYKNILRVGPSDWLSATLDAIWQEWDGALLEETDEKGRKNWMQGTVTLESDEGNAYAEPSEQKEGESTSGTPWGNAFNSIRNAFEGAGSRNSEEQQSIEPDYGAANWLVTFKSLNISLFGATVFTQQFQEKSRVWKMTYIDDDTRVVRAGRTGREEDDVVFYMSKV